MRPSHTFRERLKGDPDNPQFHFTLGQALVEEGDFEQALVPLTYCLEVKEDWLDAQALMGRCYLELRLPQKAKLQSIRQNHLARPVWVALARALRSVDTRGPGAQARTKLPN